MLQFFIMDMVEYMQGGILYLKGPDSMKCMHLISRDRGHSGGWVVGGSTATVGNLYVNSSDLVA